MNGGLSNVNEWRPGKETNSQSLMTATAGCSSVGFCSVRISPIGGCMGCPKLMRRGAPVMSGGSGDGSSLSNLGCGCGERPSGVWKASSSEEDPCKSTYGRCVNSVAII